MTAIAVAPNGEVYVGDMSGRVQRFDSSGRYLSKFGRRDPGDGGISKVSGLAVDARGIVYIADLGPRPYLAGALGAAAITAVSRTAS